MSTERSRSEIKRDVIMGGGTVDDAYTEIARSESPTLPTQPEREEMLGYCPKCDVLVLCVKQIRGTLQFCESDAGDLVPHVCPASPSSREGIEKLLQAHGRWLGCKCTDCSGDLTTFKRCAEYPSFRARHSAVLEAFTALEKERDEVKEDCIPCGGSGTGELADGTEVDCQWCQSFGKATPLSNARWDIQKLVAKKQILELQLQQAWDERARYAYNAANTLNVAELDATCLNHEHTITDLRARCSVLEADAKRLEDEASRWRQVAVC